MVDNESSGYWEVGERCRPLLESVQPVVWNSVSISSQAVDSEHVYSWPSKPSQVKIRMLGVVFSEISDRAP